MSSRRDVCAIIQARMTSTRLPGKVLLPIVGKPVLGLLLERLARCEELDRVIVATTVNREDDPIVAFCEQGGYDFSRGSEMDVVDRYFQAARTYRCDIVVRITSDCPLIDPLVVDRTVRLFLDNLPDVDYVSNTLERTFPRGMDTEVFTFESLAAAHREARGPAELEHVTPFFYRNPQRFRLLGLRNAADWSGYRLTLDTPEDLLLIEAVFAALYGDGRIFTMEEMVTLIESEPHLKALNAGVRQKELGH